MPSGQTTNSNSTTTKTVPDFLNNAQGGLLNSAGAMIGPFLNSPGYQTAGFTPDQTNAMDLTRNVAMDSFNTPSNFATLPDWNSGAFPLASGGQSTPGVATAAQLDPNAYKAFLNPYTQSVVDTTMTNLNQQKDQQLAQIGAQSAAAGSFGGSRQAVQDSLLDKNFNNTASSTIANLMSQGYDKATATALANTGFQQQAALQNAQAATQSSIANAGNSTQAGIANANLGMQRANFGLQVPQINSTLETNDQNRLLAAIQALLGTGGMQQTLAQNNLNVPWQDLQLFNSIVGPTLNNTNSISNTQGSSTTNNGLGALQTIIGGLSLLKSDEDSKTNVKKVGKVGGIPMYEYDYKTDVAAAKKSGKPMGPKRVGPMAQDIEKVAPQMVTKVGGTKMIKTA